VDTKQKCTHKHLRHETWQIKQKRIEKAIKSFFGVKIQKTIQMSPAFDYSVSIALKASKNLI
ncbi:hypothetical protein, partial [Bartonella vinsonii]|uniref:hypothetical protein n=1 Tax=Bartonella vinsonii TaxID=33047 RepID=UPI001ABABD4A